MTLSRMLKVLLVASTAPACVCGFAFGARVGSGLIAGSHHMTGSWRDPALRQLRMAEDSDTKTKERQPWEFRRFVRTIAFFNAPRPLAAARNAIRRRREQGASSALPGGCILVAIGGGDDAATALGQRVTEQLLRRGALVRALVADGKAAAALEVIGGGEQRLEVVQSNWEELPSMKPSVLEDVDRAVICAGGAGVDALVKSLKNYGDVQGRKLFSSAPGAVKSWEQWGALDDVVMGGVSTSELVVVPGEGEAGGRSSAAVFRGTVSPANNGGFASVRSRNASPPWDWSQFDALRLRVKGDGFRYKFTVYDAAGWDRPSWSYSFDTAAGEWADVVIPFSALMPIYRTKTMQDPPPLNLSTIYSLQLMLSKFEYDGGLNPTWKPGPFSLSLDSIATVKLDQTGGATPPAIVILASGGAKAPASGEGVPMTVLDAGQPDAAAKTVDMLLAR
eukprot:TRINITY_DN4472_c0_g1_i1.p1 TRINITY_DN4472_c0_g1~~TRINITY_DN4472_c0_g1_i1.p1  ORF type:complete len:449 (-),score=131.65 TRINITY_DN4472_c0_g1_i1:373-1719(-)